MEFFRPLHQRTGEINIPGKKSFPFLCTKYFCKFSGYETMIGVLNFLA